MCLLLNISYTQLELSRKFDENLIWMRIYECAINHSWDASVLCRYIWSECSCDCFFFFFIVLNEVNGAHQYCGTDLIVIGRVGAVHLSHMWDFTSILCSHHWCLYHAFSSNRLILTLYTNSWAVCLFSENVIIVIYYSGFETVLIFPMKECDINEPWFLSSGYQYSVIQIIHIFTIS